MAMTPGAARRKAYSEECLKAEILLGEIAKKRGAISAARDGKAGRSLRPGQYYAGVPGNSTARITSENVDIADRLIQLTDSQHHVGFLRVRPVPAQCERLTLESQTSVPDLPLSGTECANKITQAHRA